MKYVLPLFILLVNYSFSQQLNCSFISTEQGLPSSEVYAILQDKAGYMWFATNFGVSRYDGKKFRTYTTADGLLDNTVFRMCEDRAGRIWFGSQSNELCYWQNDSIYKSPISDVFHKKVRQHEHITVMCADSTGRLWVNSIKRTFNFKEKENGEVEFHEIKDSTLNLTHLIAVDHKETMYTLSKDMYIERKNNPIYTLRFMLHTQEEKPRYQSTTYEPGKLIPISVITHSINQQHTYFFCMNNHLYAIPEGKEVKEKVLPQRVVNLTVDRNNNLWVGYYKGGVECYKNCDLNSAPLKLTGDYTVSDVWVDHEGGAWLATLEKGVTYIPSTSILVYSNIPLLNDHITFIGKNNHQITLNTFGNTIFKEKDLQFKPDDFLMTISPYQKSNLLDVATIRDTTYLSYGDQLIRLNADLELIPHKQKSGNGFDGGKKIIESKDHSIWLFFGGGLKRVFNQTATTIAYHASQRLTCAIAGEKGVFVGGKKGLYLFDALKYLHLGYIDPLLKSSITDITRSKDGSIWITTIGNGVLRFKNNRITQLVEKDGLISNICTAITVDEKDKIWVGSNNGISCIQQADKGWKIKNITKQNGLNSNEITKLFASGDSLWVGTMSGLNWMYIPEVISPIPPSVVYIADVKVNNTTIGFTQAEFSHDENNLKFLLHGLTFKDRGNHKYRYRLSGPDTTWQETGSDEIIFTNLAPGSYSFEAQVANNDNQWSTQPARYSFTIHKPFWLTWWFILIEGIVLILVIYLIILWRTYLIKKKEAEKLRINKLLSEYQMKALTAQMNPHFIFNAINSIQNFIIQNHSTLAYDYLIKFSKLIRLVLNNSNEKEISIQQELDTLGIYIELEKLRFKNSFDYQLKVDPQLELESLMILSLLLQPYIENAIWHGLMPLKTHKGVIILYIQNENGLLKISITDNGVGRKASDQLKKKITQTNHRSVGMELTGKRIELFGQDHQFSIQIVDNYDDNDNSTGTTVEIILPMVEIY